MIRSTLRLLVVVSAVASAVASAQLPGGTAAPCGGMLSRHWIAQPGTFDGYAVLPVVPREHSSGVIGGGGGGGGLGGIDDARALLIVAVVAAAALPLVVYAMDTPASPDLLHCWQMPSDRFELYGGALASSAGPVGYVGLRAGVSAGVLGFEAAGESGFSYRDLQAAIALRAPPKQHIDLALSFGVRQVVGEFGAQSWLEVALPHRYLPLRLDAYAQGVAIEIRPALLFSPAAVDARIDAGLLLPLGHHSSLNIGVRAYSLGARLQLGGMLGMNLAL